MILLVFFFFLHSRFPVKWGIVDTRDICTHFWFYCNVIIYSGIHKNDMQIVLYRSTGVGLQNQNWSCTLGQVVQQFKFYILCHYIYQCCLWCLFTNTYIDEHNITNQILPRVYILVYLTLLRHLDQNPDNVKLSVGGKQVSLLSFKL